MTKRIEDNLSKKEEACVKRHNIKEEKKMERFDMFMEMQKNKFKLGGTKIAIKAEAEA